MEDRDASALNLIRDAGALALDFFGRFDTLQVHSKGVQDMASEADLAVEQLPPPGTGARSRHTRPPASPTGSPTWAPPPAWARSRWSPCWTGFCGLGACSCAAVRVRSACATWPAGAWWVTSRHINSWDCLGGVAVLQAAGWRVSDVLAGDGLIRGNPIVAGPLPVYDQLCALLADVT